MTPTAHLDTFARDHLPPHDQWPELLLNREEFRYPDRLNVVAELLDRPVADGRGGAVAIHTPDGSISYQQLQARVNRIVNVLQHDLHLTPGNRVLLRGANNAEMAACWLAVVKAGLIAVATMPLLRAKELGEIIDRAQIGAALCDLRLADELRAAQDQQPILRQVVYFNDPTPQGLAARCALQPAEAKAVDTAADDVALIAFTSGTTGKPKGTLHFQRDLLAICDAFPRSILKPRADDVFIGSPPLAFTFGLGGLLLFPLRYGASTVLLEKPSADHLLAAIAQYRATICFTAPTSYRTMAALAAQHDLTSLRQCVSAGEALPDATRTLWREATGIEMIDGIGATEMLHIFISAAPSEVRRGATGKPIPGYQAAVLDASGKLLPPGQVGRLAVKGPTGCRYLDDARQQDYVQGGWNLTGDAYLMDADGYFFYQARTDDMIVSAGYNIAGPEVESALLLHPAVAECAVIGVPDETRGQIVKAFVVLKPGQVGDAAMVEALQTFVKQTIAPYKYPRAMVFVESL
ncbi:MAG: AMP-binding protein, partial [Betaproteobacteria bacterium]|nr:AMP-binding protein [Betaproteobacteria bacterium]